MTDHRLISQVFSKRDMIGCLDLIQACVRCRSEDEFRNIMCAIGETVPHDKAICGLARFGGTRSIKSYDIVNVSYPAEWLEYQVLNSRPFDDPVIRANFDKFQVQHFEDIQREYEYPPGYLASAVEYGFGEGYVHGVWDAGLHGGSIFVFSGRKLARSRRMEAALEILTPHLHQALSRILDANDEDHCATKPLSEKEREVLKWLAAGKSTWDISVLLAISERTVKFHVANILQKLDASNRAHAVAIAVERGMVNIG